MSDDGVSKNADNRRTGGNDDDTGAPYAARRAQQSSTGFSGPGGVMCNIVNGGEGGIAITGEAARFMQPAYVMGRGLPQTGHSINSMVPGFSMSGATPGTLQLPPYMFPPGQEGAVPFVQTQTHGFSQHGTGAYFHAGGSAFGTPFAARSDAHGTDAAGANHGAGDAKRSRTGWEGEWNVGSKAHNTQTQDGQNVATNFSSAVGVATENRPFKKPRARPGTHVARKCPHDRRKSRCKECGGVEICEHDRVRSR